MNLNIEAKVTYCEVVWNSYEERNKDAKQSV